MYFNDHTPPHFHAKYNDFRAEILIETLAVRDGQLPPRILGLVLEWAAEHKDELLENWNLLKETGNFTKIKPLILGEKSMIWVVNAEKTDKKYEILIKFNDGLTGVVNFEKMECLGRKTRGEPQGRRFIAPR